MTRTNGESFPIISKLAIEGFKSIKDRREIALKPLTLISGANSSGKTSIFQPLLLMKQTLEAGFDPGAFLLDGAHVKFTDKEQMLSRIGASRVDRFAVHLDTSLGPNLTVTYSAHGKESFQVVEQKQSYDHAGRTGTSTLKPNMTREEIRALFPDNTPNLTPEIFSRIEVQRSRCFLNLAFIDKDEDSRAGFINMILKPILGFASTGFIDYAIRSIIHLPGLRGNPTRAYPVTSIGSNFPGPFHPYTASVIAKWEKDGDNDKLDGLKKDLQELGLAWKVLTRKVNLSDVEIKVSRAPRSSRGGANDVVNIVDVGFGLSQTLPILVALQEAAPGQLVYIEQPEVHLHPAAQYRLGEVFARAVSRGVRLVVETHSSMLLLSIQTLVARGDLNQNDLALQWFTRDAQGQTQVAAAEVDDKGRFGKWPVDFGDVQLEAESKLLDAMQS